MPSRTTGSRRSATRSSMRWSAKRMANNPDLRVAARACRTGRPILVQAAQRCCPGWQSPAPAESSSGGGGDPSSALQGIVAAASWELDLWGRVRYARNAAAGDVRIGAGRLRVRAPVDRSGQAKAWFTATQLTQQATSPRRWWSRPDSCNHSPDRERVGVGTDAETALARADDYSRTPWSRSNSRAVRRCAHSNCCSAVIRPPRSPRAQLHGPARPFPSACRCRCSNADPT